MTEKKEVQLVVEKPVISKAVFVDFETEREEWNKYRLADKTVLRIKFVISRVEMEESLDEIAKKVKPGQKLKLALGFSATTVYGVESPPELRGDPDPKKCTTEELRASIVDAEIDFETVRATWNSYVLQNGIRVKARFSPISISRTSKFDGGGMPVYFIHSGVDVKVNLPERIEKILRKKETKTVKTKKP